MTIKAFAMHTFNPPFYLAVPVPPVFVETPFFSPLLVRMFSVPMSGIPGVSVLLVPSPGPVAAKVTWQGAAAEGSRSAGPDGPLCTCCPLLVTAEGETSRVMLGKPSAQAVSGRFGILKRPWHANEKKRCFPWPPRTSDNAWLIPDEVSVWMYFWN